MGKISALGACGREEAWRDEGIEGWEGRKKGERERWRDEKMKDH